MSNFDKDQYWSRRRNVETVRNDKGKAIDKIRKPLRGQGDKPMTAQDAPLARWTQEDFEAGKCQESEIGAQRSSGVEMRMTKNGLQPYPRRDRRVRNKTKSVSPLHPNGVSYSHKDAIHTVNPPNDGIQLPITHPKLTNHDRMKMRSLYRTGRGAEAEAIMAEKTGI